MTPLLSVRGLGVAYRRDGNEVRALEGIDLDLAPGEKLAVIGESGSGKSTLALAVAGLLPAAAKVTGQIEWYGSSDGAAKSPTTPLWPAGHLPLKGGDRLSRPVNGRDIGFVFQDPAASLDPVLTVGEQIAEVARAHRGMDWRQAYGLAEDLLSRVKLPEPAAVRKAYPHQLSGGQKQRVAIAAAIAGKPGLLIADEATSALDTIVQKDIVALLGQLTGEDGMALLFITHDIALASEIADRIVVFRDGRLVEAGTAEQVVASPREAYTRSLLEAHLGIEDAGGVVR